MSTVPITVVGDVDPRAVRQLERCAAAGDALRGALCADGHVGYCVPLDTEILTKRRWLSHYEVVVGDETIGLDPKTGLSVWTPITAVSRDRCEVVRLGHSTWSVRVTPGHRWWADRRIWAERTHRTRPALVRTDEINSEHRLILSRPFVGGDLAISAEEARVLGWLLCDGHITRDAEGRPNPLVRESSATIYQAKPAGRRAIESLLADVPHSVRVRQRPRTTWPSVAYRLSSDYIRALWLRAALDRLSIPEFVLGLTREARDGFLAAVIGAEGSDQNGYTRIAQNPGEVHDAIALAVYLCGFAPRPALHGPHCRTIGVGKRFPHGAFLKRESLGAQPVWCVSTELGSWTMRQDERIMLTGNSQPIGGAVAYAGYISPSGVGYDIGCIAAGERVLTSEGCHVAIERLGGADVPVRPCADGMLSPVSPYLFCCAKGPRPVVKVSLSDGRAVRLTAEHEVRTTRGWVRADELATGEVVLCPAFTGLPFEPSPVSGAFLRLVGYGNGGRHAPAVGAESASIYAAIPDHLAAMVRDVTSESNNNRGLVERLVDFGCPTGRKRDASWTTLTRNLLELPAWARAQYLAGLVGAGATTPRYTGRPVNLVVKQRGEAAMAHVATLMESLGFRWAVTVVDGIHVGQLLGGACEQLRFVREVGFAYASGKSRAAAQMASAAVAATPVAAAVGPTAAFVAEESRQPATLGGCCWVPVRAVEPDGIAETYDVVTEDPEQAFIVSGVTVHNCGNKATRTHVRVEDLQPDLAGVMDSIESEISFGVGLENPVPVESDVLDAIREAPFEPQRQLYDLAAKQLGTVGAGNHYVDLFEGDDGFVWVGVHFGSRGFGHKTASGFLALAQGKRFDEQAAEGEMDSPPILLAVDSELGRAYIEAMTLAGAYAYAGRDAVVAKVLEILGAESTYEVHNHHNFAWRERHSGADVWVIRKGCTPAFPGQEGFVGATMGEPSVILRGVESGASPSLLYSTVHGAGRVMSRTRAAGRRRRRLSCPACGWFQERGEARPRDGRCPRCGARRLAKRLVQVSPGEIDFPSVRSSLVARGIELRGGAADEAPGAYKRLDDVLAAHADTIEVVHRLTPIGVAMAGADTFDPYKD